MCVCVWPLPTQRRGSCSSPSTLSRAGAADSHASWIFVFIWYSIYFHQAGSHPRSNSNTFGAAPKPLTHPLTLTNSFTHPPTHSSSLPPTHSLIYPSLIGYRALGQWFGVEVCIKVWLPVSCAVSWPMGVPLWSMIMSKCPFKNLKQPINELTCNHVILITCVCRISIYLWDFTIWCLLKSERLNLL